MNPDEEPTTLGKKKTLPQGRDYRIPFNKPFLVGKELHYIGKAVLSGQLGGDGVFTKKCEALMKEKIGGERVLLTPSGTAALEMTALLCGIDEGDEVIMPSFAFSSTANAFALRRAVPVFVDIREDTLNLDERLIGKAVTDRTRAIVPVHYGGAACEMESILDLAKKHGLWVIEDAAHGLNAAWRGRKLGTIGDMGIFSFHETKNCISGEGGALVLNRPELVERAEIIREKGTNRAKFFRCEIEKYCWVELGCSGLPSEVVSAFLFAQLEAMEEIQKRRVAILDRYMQSFGELEESGRVRLPVWGKDCDLNGHLFYLLLGDERTRRALADHLADSGILAVHHYVPLHDSDFGRKAGRKGSDLGITEDVSSRLLRLPMFYELQDSEQAEVIESVKRFFA